METSLPTTAVPSPIADYLKLTKPRVTLLLVFTAFSALIVAAGGLPSFQVVLGTVVGGWLAAAGASTLNHYLERDLDARMTRTRNRPLPSGRIAPLNALLFGIGLLAWSALTLMVLVNLLAAALALLGALYYVVGYTLLLKRSTALNIVIGGGAGAFPVLVGWAAGTGALDIGAWLLFATIFFWTPPHSWAFALLVQSDYERGTVPMMPVVHGTAVTHAHLLWYTVHLFVVTVLVYAVGVAGTVYLASVMLLSAALFWVTFRMLLDPSKAAAKRLYKTSSLYLGLLFVALIADALLR